MDRLDDCANRIMTELFYDERNMRNAEKIESRDQLKAFTLETALVLDSIPWQQSTPSSSNTFNRPGYRL